jgi:hypothetical protein
MAAVRQLYLTPDSAGRACESVASSPARWSGLSLACETASLSGRARLAGAYVAGIAQYPYLSCTRRKTAAHFFWLSLHPALSGVGGVQASDKRSEIEAPFRQVRLAAHSVRPIV